MKTLMLAIALLVFADQCAADTQHTAFTYRGSLSANGQPANRLLDLTFTLFDAAISGNQIGAPIGLSQVQVTNGTVVQDLDFSDAFTGQQLWLEVKVGSQILTPRQAINSVPVAQYAPPVFAGASANVYTPTPNTASLMPISGLYYDSQTPSIVQINGDQTITLTTQMSPGVMHVMPTSGRLTRIFGNMVNRPGGTTSGTVSATLYLGAAGTNVLAPTSLVCTFTLSSAAATSCAGTSAVTYAAGQTAVIVVRGAVVSLTLASISMAP